MKLLKSKLILNWMIVLLFFSCKTSNTQLTVDNKNNASKNIGDMESYFNKNRKEYMERIPDITAKKYYKRYCKKFAESAFEKQLIVNNIIIQQMQDIIKSKNIEKIGLFFTDNNGNLDIVFDDMNGKKYLISGSKLKELQFITPSEFENMNNAFRKKNGIYDKMADIRHGLFRRSSKFYTEKVIISTKKFMEYDAKDNSKTAIFLPGIITNRKYDSSNTHNERYQITLIMAVLKKKDNKEAEFEDWDEFIYYDNFCLNPPDKC